MDFLLVAVACLASMVHSQGNENVNIVTASPIGPNKIPLVFVFKGEGSTVTGATTTVTIPKNFNVNVVTAAPIGPNKVPLVFIFKGQSSTAPGATTSTTTTTVQPGATAPLVFIFKEPSSTAPGATTSTTTTAQPRATVPVVFIFKTPAPTMPQEETTIEQPIATRPRITYIETTTRPYRQVGYYGASQTQGGYKMRSDGRPRESYRPRYSAAGRTAYY